MTADNPYASPACSPRDGRLATALRRIIRDLTLSYFLTAYALVVAWCFYEWYTRGSILYSNPVVDVVQLLTTPLMLPYLLLYAFGNWLSGFLPTSKFTAFIAVVVVPWMVLFTCLRMPAMRGQPTSHGRTGGTVKY
jgi:hypothetical protein